MPLIIPSSGQETEARPAGRDGKRTSTGRKNQGVPPLFSPSSRWGEEAKSDRPPEHAEEETMANKEDMSLDERMKYYESLEAGRRLLPLVPACARVDGRNFHTFCRGLQRP